LICMAAYFFTPMLSALVSIPTYLGLTGEAGNFINKSYAVLSQAIYFVVLLFPEPCSVIQEILGPDPHSPEGRIKSCPFQRTCGSCFDYILDQVVRHLHVSRVIH
jgi:hypothetical protein